MDGFGSWWFGVSHPGSSASWLSAPEELEFETDGTDEPRWYADTLPLFLMGLQLYLEWRGLDPERRTELASAAEQQARALFQSQA